MTIIMLVSVVSIAGMPSPQRFAVVITWYGMSGADITVSQRCAASVAACFTVDETFPMNRRSILKPPMPSVATEIGTLTEAVPVFTVSVAVPAAMPCTIPDAVTDATAGLSMEYV